MARVILVCEGVRQGVDARLIEVARARLQADGLRRAMDLQVMPAGSKGMVGQLVAALRSSHQSAVGLRDRDYLSRGQVDHMRSKSAGTAFPLSRSSIESYLLDPSVLSACTGLSWSDVLAVLEAKAAALRWRAAVDAACEAYNGRHRLHLAMPEASVASQSDALKLLNDGLEAYRTQVDGNLKSFDPATVLAVVDQDHLDDGPLWTRVRGKTLLGEVARGGVPFGVQGGLANRAAAIVEQGLIPQQLLDDLTALLDSPHMP